MREDKPSATAMIVAAGCLSVARTPELRSLVSAEWRNMLERTVSVFPAPERLWLGILSQKALRWLVELLERFSIPGLSLHFVLRKRTLERAVRSAIGEGFTQVVILGGGFDTMASRLAPVFPSVNFFELDHPATQKIKAAVFDHNFPGNLNFSAVDFTRQGWESVLGKIPAFSPAKNTLFLCEGVLMYLAPREVDAVFAAVRQSGNGRAQFLFTFMEIQPNGRPHFCRATKVSDAWLRLKGESYLWGLSPQELESYLRERGFSMKKFWGSDELKNGIEVGKSTLAVGEWIALAENKVI
ncbi:MAG: class I SAM-dependent methyltransferase [Elusimicrobia bacterium]|nr:class I SAM-dependent methyltransferase [Elusimicrobiota bacterium]